MIGAVVAWHGLDDWDSIPVKDTKILISYVVNNNFSLLRALSSWKEGRTTQVTALHIVQE
jgi:hypothetical protein